MSAGLSQLLNGHVFSFSSIRLTVATPVPVILTRFTSLSYEHSLTPGELRGNSAVVIGRTRGEYSANASLTAYLEEWSLLQKALMAALPLLGGFMEKSFIVAATYAEEACLPKSDVLSGCRVVRVGRSYSNGSDALLVDLDLHVMRVIEDGIPAVIDGSGII